MDTHLSQEHRLPSQGSCEGRNDLSSGCFDFMNLYVELRELVYGFALARPDPLSVQIRHESLQNNSNHRSVPDSASQAPAGTKSGSKLTKNSCDKTVTRNNLNLAILRVSKTVYSEARPVLYGSNTFTMSVGDAFQTLRLLSSSRNFVRHLRFEFSEYRDLFIRFPSLAQNHLRYFRGLKDLVLIFPEDPSEEYWEPLPGQNILSDEPSLSSKLATESLIRAVDWVPISTEVTLIRANFGQNISWTRKESAKDQKIEGTVQRMIQQHITALSSFESADS